MPCEGVGGVARKMVGVGWGGSRGQRCQRCWRGRGCIGEDVGCQGGRGGGGGVPEDRGASEVGCEERVLGFRMPPGRGEVGARWGAESGRGVMGLRREY